MKRVFVSDCEGPISKNDNAFELTAHFVPEGDRLFTMLSRYDDVLADLVKRVGYEAGDTLKLVLPFLKACGVTDRKMREFSSRNILLMPGAREMLAHVETTMPSFIVSTSYEHYMRVLCDCVGFPFENTYCTRLNIGDYDFDQSELEKIECYRREIVSLPLIEVAAEAKSLEALSERDQRTVKKLDKIFWSDFRRMQAGRMLHEVNPVDGSEKAEAVRDIAKKTCGSLSNIMYVGDSITDLECFRLMRENDGLAVSFNGNAYAVREAEVAVLSENAVATAVIADVFRRQGKKAVLKAAAEKWSLNTLKEHHVDPTLQETAAKIFQQKPPRLQVITADNRDKLMRESSEFRKHVRGEAVGSLG